MKRLVEALGLSKMTRDQWKYLGLVMIIATLTGAVSALVMDMVTT